MRCWILVPESGEVVVKHDTNPVRILIQRGLQPTVACVGSHFYPRSWQGFIDQDGETVKWNYPAGPVKQVRIQTDPEGVRWVWIVWR